MPQRCMKLNIAGKIGVTWPRASSFPSSTRYSARVCPWSSNSSSCMPSCLVCASFCRTERAQWSARYRIFLSVSDLTWVSLRASSRSFNALKCAANSAPCESLPAGIACLLPPCQTCEGSERFRPRHQDTQIILELEYAGEFRKCSWFRGGRDALG